MSRPKRSEFLPSFRHFIGEEEINEVVDTLRSDWITRGPKTQRFEEDFKEYIGCRNAVAVSSCTAALHLALVACDIGPGDEYITTPLTFAASAEVAFYTGARPVFCDIELDTYNIDPKKIEPLISERTRAILPVHYAGHPCELSLIQKIAEDHDLKVIEDAAHALPAKHDGRIIGTISDMTCFSFYATKNLATAEGGMVTTNDDEAANKMKTLSLHGISKDAWNRYSAEGSWYYEIQYAGYKYNFTDIQAAMGIHQLRRLDSMQRRRRELLAIYKDGLGDIDEIILPKERGNVQHAWHLFPVLIRPEKLRIGRNQFIEEMRKWNIGTSVHFIPLHLHPFYRSNMNTAPGDYPNSEFVYEREISIPFYPRMTDEDCLDVIWAMKDIIKENKS